MVHTYLLNKTNAANKTTLFGRQLNPICKTISRFILSLLLLLIFPGIGTPQSIKNFISDNSFKENILAQNEETILKHNFQLLPATQSKMKAASTEAANPDSAIEFINHGIYSESYKWYFTYQTNGYLKSSYCYYYNSEGDFEMICERQIYNSDGQITLYAQRMPIPYLLYWDKDSTYYDVYTKEYTYENGNLVYLIETDSSNIYHSAYRNDKINFDETYYTYNEKNLLIKSTSYSFSTPATSATESSGEIYYQYTDDSKLEYIITPQAPALSVNKYEYEYTSTIKCTSVNYITLRKYSTPFTPDTITVWDQTKRFYETFDEKGRQKTILVTNQDSGNDECNDYSVDYTYTVDDLQTTAIYYRWEGLPDSGSWTPAMIIKETFNDDGYLLSHENKIYNSASGNWITINEKNYYYPGYKSISASDTERTGILSIYPNPAGNCLYIKGTSESNYSIFNLTGKKILHGKAENGIVDINSLKKGAYLIYIEGNNTRQVQKFFKIEN